MKPIVLILLLIFFSCSVRRGNNTPDKVGEAVTAIDTVSAIGKTMMQPYNAVNTDTVKILREVYVTAFKGAEIFDKNGEGEHWGLPFGTRFEVIKEVGDKLMVVDVSKKQLEPTNFYYVNRSDTGLETEIPFSSYYLNLSFTDAKFRHEFILTEPSFWDDKDKYTNESFTESFNPDEIEDIEVSSVSKEVFLSMQPKGKKLFFKNDAVKKVNGIITIAGKEFKDSVNEPYQNVYTYLGEYPFLNAYVLEYMCSECEGYSYKVVRKKTGSIMATFDDFPYYFADKKAVITVGQLFSDSPTNVSFYLRSLPHIVFAYKEFGSWIPVGNAFWGTDGNFYTQAIPYVTAGAYYQDKEKRDSSQYNFRYLQIKIKGPTP